MRYIERLGHLVPDFVVRRARQLRVVDAKYNAHLAELGYARAGGDFTEEAREANRADIQQAVANSALFDEDEDEDEDEVVATLVYALQKETYQALRRQEREKERPPRLSRRPSWIEWWT